PFDGTLLASTTFTAPTLASSDVSVPLSVVLSPGDYALVIGTGLFGASGAGVLATNNTSLGASYLTWNGSSWTNCCNADVVPRLVVYGTTAVPEPTTIALVGVG